MEVNSWWLNGFQADQVSLVKNRLLLEADFVRVLEDERPVGPVVGRQLDHRVELLNGPEEVGHEVSRIDRRQLENVAEKHDLGKLAAGQKTLKQLREQLKIVLDS